MQNYGEDFPTVVANATFGTSVNVAQHCLNISDGLKSNPTFFVKARNLDGNIKNASLAAQFVYSAVNVDQTFIDVTKIKRNSLVFFENATVFYPYVDKWTTTYGTTTTKKYYGEVSQTQFPANMFTDAIGTVATGFKVDQVST